VTDSKKKKAGYVAIIGLPNVGKSTLLNRLVGEKLAGVSPKPQTTRDSIRGIFTDPALGQIVFVDTPGIHSPRDLLGRWMAREVEKSLEGIDLVYWMVLPDDRPCEEEILEKIKALGLPVFLLINQIDRYPKPFILPVIDRYHKAFAFREIIPISAKLGDQVDLLLEKTFEALPEGEPSFEQDQISDQNERFLVRELIREKLFHFTEEEIPYSTSVVIESFTDREDGIAEINATVVVEKDSQKAIVIGKRGEMMKRIGTAARLDIERLLGRKVFLKVWVRTMDRWKSDPSAMRGLGYGDPA
jgi:GTP-binding protein Era